MAAIVPKSQSTKRAIIQILTFPQHFREMLQRTSLYQLRARHSQKCWRRSRGSLWKRRRGLRIYEWGWWLVSLQTMLSSKWYLTLTTHRQPRVSRMLWLRRPHCSESLSWLCWLSNFWLVNYIAYIPRRINTLQRCFVVSESTMQVLCISDVVK